MMAIYDKMKNPDVPITDIAIRQAKLGAAYALYHDSSDSFTAPLNNEKARLLPLFGQYVEENYALEYETAWSEWLKYHNPTVE